MKIRPEKEEFFLNKFWPVQGIICLCTCCIQITVIWKQKIVGGFFCLPFFFFYLQVKQDSNIGRSFS